MRLPVALSLLHLTLALALQQSGAGVRSSQTGGSNMPPAPPAFGAPNERAVTSRRLAESGPAKGPSRSGQEAGGRKRRRHLRLVTLETPPFMMKRRGREGDGGRAREGEAEAAGSNNGTALWYGYCMDFFLELIKHLPYEVSFELHEAADARFGSKQRDRLAEERWQAAESNRTGSRAEFRRIESWNGLVGELQQRRADLALAPLAVMAERELEIDFTVPFYDLVGIQILLKRPEVAQNWFKFLTVLDNDVWFSIGLAYFLTSFVIYLFDRLSPYSHRNLARIKRVSARAGRTNRPQGDILLKARGHPVAPSGEAKFYLTRSLAAAAAATSGGEKLQTISGAQADSHALWPNGNCRPSPGKLSASSAPLAGGVLTLPHAEQEKGRRRRSQEYLDQLRARLGPLGRGRSGSSGAGERHAEGHDEDEASDEEEDEELAELDGRPDFNLRDSLWFCITSLTPQGGGEAPQNLSGRVVAGAWWLFCFIVIASYTANLAAFLTVSRLEIPIESLDDLAKQYRIKYAPIDGTAEQTYFERMAYIEEIFYNIWKEMSLNGSLSERERSKFSVWDYPISDKYTKIWDQIQEAGMPRSLEVAMARVKSSTLEDGFALLADANMIKYAVMTDCSLKAVGDEFSRKPIALGLAKGQDELRDDISYAILQLINKRFMEVLREKWWTNNPARLVCETNEGNEGISVENIGGVFIIILAGILLSFLAWTLERFAYSAKVEMSRQLLDQRLAALAASRTAASRPT